MKNFRLVDTFQGYFNKRDITNMPSNALVIGSQNVIINDSEKVATRRGYIMDGERSGGEGDEFNPIVSSYDWLTSTGQERILRSWGENTSGVLEYRYVDEDGDIHWIPLLESMNSARINFTDWWDNDEAIDLLLFVSGENKINMWSGAVTTFASATANTITKQGSGAWAESRFLTGGTRQVVIEGTVYTYTGGENTDTLTGVTPDPSSAGHTVGAVVHQAVRVSADTPDAGVKNHIIKNLYNQIYVADINRRDVFISNVTDYEDFTITSPRAPGDPAVLTLDAPPVGFIPQEDSMYISAKKDQWYKVEFTLSNDLLGESLDVRRLKTAPGQGALSQSAIGHIKNNVVFISNEPTLDTLGRLENIDTPQSLPLSDPIKLDFDRYDFTDASVAYFKSQIFIAVPRESRVLIYDIERGLWQPPQILPVGRFSVIGNELYGHSSASPETYKLFEGTNDNGFVITARAVFSYRHFGRRDWKKNFNEWFTEGYISASTKLVVTFLYDFGGSNGVREHEIRGDDENNLFQPFEDASLGKNPFGDNPLGSLLSPIPTLSKLRHIKNMIKQDFYEIQVIYSSDDIDQQWELLSFGGNVGLSTYDNIEIKK